MAANALSGLQRLGFFVRRVSDGAIDLEAPGLLIIPWKQTLHPEPSDKAGRRLPRYAVHRHCSDDARRRESGLRGIKVGLHSVVERWVGDDHSNRPVTSEKTLLAMTSPSMPLAANVARLASTAAALTSHRVKRTFGEWLAKATERTPAPQPTSSTLPLVCGVSVESSSWPPTSKAAVTAEDARQRFDGQIFCLGIHPHFSASKTGCFSRRPW